MLLVHCPLGERWQTISSRPQFPDFYRQVGKLGYLTCIESSVSYSTVKVFPVSDSNQTRGVTVLVMVNDSCLVNSRNNGHVASDVVCVRMYLEIEENLLLFAWLCCPWILTASHITKCCSSTDNRPQVKSGPTYRILWSAGEAWELGIFIYPIAKNDLFACYHRNSLWLKLLKRFGLPRFEFVLDRSGHFY